MWGKVLIPESTLNRTHKVMQDSPQSKTKPLPTIHGELSPLVTLTNDAYQKATEGSLIHAVIALQSFLEDPHVVDPYAALASITGLSKGTIIKAAIKSIDISDGRLVVHLSIWQLTATVAIWLFSLIAGIALAIALALNPECLGPLILLSALTPTGD